MIGCGKLIEEQNNNQQMGKKQIIDDSAQVLEDSEQSTPRYNSLCKLVLLTITFSLSFYYIGYNFVYFGTFDINLIVDVFDIKIDKWVALGLVTGTMLASIIIGYLLTNCFLSLLSRSYLILLVNFIGIVVGCISMIPNFGLLFFCRIMQGICIGIYSTAIPIILKELLPKEVEKKINFLTHLLCSLGAFSALLLQFFVHEFNVCQEQIWRLLFIFMIVPMIIQTILMLTAYRFQTPKYLLMEKMEEQCKSLLAYIYKEKFVNEIFKQLKMEIESKPEDLRVRVQITVEEIFPTEPNEKKENNPPNKEKNQETQNSSDKSSLLMNFVSIQLSILHQFAGIQAFAAYAVLIIVQVFPDYHLFIPLMLAILPVIGSFTISKIMENLGRKTVIQVGTFLMFVAHLLIAVGFYVQENSLKEVQEGGKIVILVGCCIFMLFFGITLGCGIFVYISQISTEHVMKASTIINWVAGSLIGFVFPMLNEKFGSPAPIFTFFSVWCFLSFLINCKLGIESKDKNRILVEDEYSKMKIFE